MQRTETPSILRLRALLTTRQELSQANHSSSSQLKGWDDLEPKVYRRLCQFLTPAADSGRRAG